MRPRKVLVIIFMVVTVTLAVWPITTVVLTFNHQEKQP